MDIIRTKNKGVKKLKFFDTRKTSILIDKLTETRSLKRAEFQVRSISWKGPVNQDRGEVVDRRIRRCLQGVQGDYEQADSVHILR